VKASLDLKENFNLLNLSSISSRDVDSMPETVTQELNFIRQSFASSELAVLQLKQDKSARQGLQRRGTVPVSGL
jgi:hypothetical protein